MLTFARPDHNYALDSNKKESNDCHSKLPKILIDDSDFEHTVRD